MVQRIVKFEGDKKIKARLKKFMDAKQKIKGYDVGFFKSSTYPETKNGQIIYTAEVAVYNEFGTRSKNGNVHIPERPFFRQANKKVEKPLIRLIDHKLTEKNSYILNEQLVKKLSIVHEGAVKQRITDLREPPNHPSTIKKKGSDNPLIDTGNMRRSVTHKVIK